MSDNGCGKCGSTPQEQCWCDEKPERDIDIIKGYINRLEQQELQLAQQKELLDEAVRVIESCPGDIEAEGIDHWQGGKCAREFLAKIKEIK